MVQVFADSEPQGEVADLALHIVNASYRLVEDECMEAYVPVAATDKDALMLALQALCGPEGELTSTVVRVVE